MIAVTRSFPHSPLLSSLSLFVFFFYYHYFSTTSHNTLWRISRLRWLSWFHIPGVLTGATVINLLTAMCQIIVAQKERKYATMVIWPKMRMFYESLQAYKQYPIPSKYDANYYLGLGNIYIKSKKKKNHRIVAAPNSLIFSWETRINCFWNWHTWFGPRFLPMFSSSFETFMRDLCVILLEIIFFFVCNYANKVSCTSYML